MRWAICVIVLVLAGCGQMGEFVKQDERGCWYREHNDGLSVGRWQITDKRGLPICGKIIPAQRSRP